MHDTEKENEVLDVKNGSIVLSTAHVPKADIPILSQLIQHLNFLVLADLCDNYLCSVFVINIFGADLNKWLHGDII